LDQVKFDENLEKDTPIVLCDRKECSFCVSGKCSHICITIAENGICTSGDQGIKEKDLL